MADPIETLSNYKTIGLISNNYGYLHVKHEGAKYYWSIHNWNGFRWEEIPEILYNELIKFEDNRTTSKESLIFEETEEYF